MNDSRDKTMDGAANRDPITGAPGAHPVGVGIGAAVGGAVAGAAVAGAAAGTVVGGPIGALAGAAIGAVAGAFGGKAVAEHYDPTVEDGYWREHHAKADYARPDDRYDDDYAPAYRLGGEARGRYDGETFDAAEDRLSTDWEQNRGTSSLSWDDARPASRAAWDRLTR